MQFLEGKEKKCAISGTKTHLKLNEYKEINKSYINEVFRTQTHNEAFRTQRQEDEYILHKWGL